MSSHICRLLPLLLVSILLFSGIVHSITAQPCISCTNSDGISTLVSSISELNLSDISSFRSVDPRDIGRALDLSQYNQSEINELMNSTIQQDSDSTDLIPDGMSTMNLETDVVLAVQEANHNLKRFVIPEEEKDLPPGNISLLENFTYVPAEWDQTGHVDTHCGNCWVWADTGALQLDLARQMGVHDTLSVQYFTSGYHNGTGIWACCGGYPAWFADYYNQTKKVISVHNTNASFQDSGSLCEKGLSSQVPLNSIGTDTSYTLNSVEAEMIETNSRYTDTEISRETAISAIKAAIHSGRGVILTFTPSDWEPFMDFWNNETESDIYTPIFNQSPGSLNDGGHAMLVVGYNDEDPLNRYWTVLNSWGAPENRPHGLLRFSMDLNYSLRHGDGVNALDWYLLNATWEK